MRFYKVMVFLVLMMITVGTFSQKVYTIDLDSPIHPVSEEYVISGINAANKEGADLIVLLIDTPGGYVKNVEAIQRAIIQSKAVVVGFVSPSGARAASGGALVAVACDLIAMAPGTTIGSAHPVSGLPIPISPPNPNNPDQKQKPEEDVMMDKVINDINAHLRSIAEIRGRNPEPIQKMVKESISLTEKEALDQGVIELIAKDQNDLFEKLKNREVKRFDKSVTKLKGNFDEPIEFKKSFRQKILMSLANPEVAFLLLIVGLLGLFVEFKSPGLIFPGVIGGISILLYLISLPLLPVNAIGIILIILGVVFFILEIKVVSYGILGTGGAIALLIGSLMLYRGNPLTGEGLQFSFVFPVVLGFVAILAFLVYLAIKAFKNPVQAGVEAMIGQRGIVKEKIDPPSMGKVFVFGEYWNASSNEPIDPEEEVVVESVNGMVLKVKKVEKGG